MDDTLARDLLPYRIIHLSSDVGVQEKGQFQTNMEVIEAVVWAQVFGDRALPGLVPDRTRPRRGWSR
jgi:hypothetical protein